MKVRIADISDIKQIHLLAGELLEKSVYSGIKMDSVKFKMTVATLISTSKGIVFVVVDEEDRAQGFLLGIVSDLFFSKAKYATDLATYVRDRYRMWAPFMIKRFVDWAKSKAGVKEITLGISSGIGDTDRAGRMYTRLGFAPVGGLFVMRTGG